MTRGGPQDKPQVEASTGATDDKNDP
jgi:hypothetical protein